MPAPKPGQQIELHYARQLVKNYKDNKLGQTLSTDDTQAVWFSKETILSALGLDPETNTDNITGLRFYLGAYGNKTENPSGNDKNDMLTLVITHTGTDTIEITSGEVAFADIIDEPDAGKKTQPSYPNPSIPSNKLHTYNDGQICPPPRHPDDPGLLNW